MKVLYDAGSIARNVIHSESSVTFPPLPLTFEGNIDLETFFLYDQVVMDEMSLEYLLGEKLISNKTKAFIRELHTDKVIITKDYKSLLLPHVDEIQEASQRDYVHLKQDLKLHRSQSIYAESKRQWQEFAARLGHSESATRYFSDTHESVARNLRRIEDYRLIPRDWTYLLRNIQDVNCLWILARELELPLHVWQDWEPYYALKASTATTELLVQRELFTASEKSRRAIIERLWKFYLPAFDLNTVDPDRIRRLMEKDLTVRLRQLIEKSNLSPQSVAREELEELQADVARFEFRTHIFSPIFFCCSLLVGFLVDPIVGSGVCASLYAAEKGREYLLGNQTRYRIHRTMKDIGDVVLRG